VRTDTYTFLTILCAVDFSVNSGDALRYAGVLAQRFRARLLVLNVADPLLVTAARTRMLDLIVEIQKDLRKLVDVTLPGAGSWRPAPDIIVRTGEPGREILEVADREHVDLVAMGTYGMTGVRKLIFGSTTERVLRNADIPVLTVPVSNNRARARSVSTTSSETRARDATSLMNSRSRRTTVSVFPA